jgi:ribokinase
VTVTVPPETELAGDDVAAALSGRHAAVVVGQLDLRPDAVDGLLRGERPEVLIGNLVPHHDLDRRRLAELDVLVVNRAEAAEILGVDRVEPLAAARRLCQLGPRAMVVTAGADGAAHCCAQGSAVVPAPVVAVVDVSGAGDAFLAAVALGLSRPRSLPQAVTMGVRMGSQAVQSRGALLGALRP